LYQSPRGTSDILPEEQVYWRYIEHKAAAICQLYGYERIDTPVFEDTDLFSRSAGEYTNIVQKEMYTFDDRGGNSLTLKPEGTPAVCRAYLQHGMSNLPQPVKLYYVSPIFRYDRPQAGRYRQHYQFGCEAIGSDDPSLDAEVIDLAWQFYISVGTTGCSLHINSIGCRKCRPGYLDALKKHYSGHTDKLCADCKTRLGKNPMRLLDCSQPSCQPVADSAPKSTDYLCDDCNEHFKRLKDYLGLLEIPFEEDHRMVRGIDYYTRTVFEIVPPQGGSQSSLGGGGRYDNLIEELGGKPTPGVGFGIGMERVILGIKEQNVEIPPLARPQVFIACVGDKAEVEAVRLASRLRRAGIGAIQAVGSRSLKAQLRQSNNYGMKKTVIIGEQEVESGTVVLRDMTTASQETVPVERLPELLS
jgi:histidyl-tRNA synthetase